MSSSTRTLTFITRRPPYGSDHARAMLDMVLASAVFDQQVQFLFLDDGVYQLLDQQAPDQLPAKSLAANLSALPLFGVEQVFVDAAALAARGLQAGDLVLPVTLVDETGMQDLITASDQVFLS